MKTGRGLIRTIALLICLVMIGTLLPVMAGADLATPQLTGAKASGTGILVTWKAVKGVPSYRVFRKTGGSGWTILGNTTGTSWHDTSAAEKITYTYTVRGVSDGAYVTGYDNIGVSAAWTKDTAGIIGTPTMYSATNENKGIRVKWGKVETSPGYRIFRKTGTSDWVKLKDVADVDNYLDTAVESGKTYTYTVRCVKNGSMISSYDPVGVSCTFKPGNIAAPVLVSASAEGKGLRVVWKAVKGAYAYRVFRKTEGGSWAELVNVKTTSYLDNATTSGVTYIYTVRCLDANNNMISSFDAKGVKASWSGGNVEYSTPVLASLVCAPDGLTLTWKEVIGAPMYQIFRKEPGKDWTALKATTATSYTDKTVKSGTQYTYTVRVRDAAGNMISGYDANGRSRLYVAAPKLVSASSLNDGIKVTWKTSAGAAMYKIFRKTGSGGWEALNTVTSGTTSYTDKKVTAGKTYTYTVRAVATDRTTFTSSYNETGITATFIGKCAITDLVNELKGVRVKWLAVDGAASYNVMRRTGEGGWIKLKNTTNTNYLDTKAVNNTTHYYQVRALDGDGKIVGSYDTNGQGITYYVAPTLVNCERYSGGLRTTWEAVTGIYNYVIYRRYGVGNWEQVGTSTGTSYTDFTPPSGTLCYYTVKCADAYGNPVSASRTPGVGQTSYMDQPILNAAVNNNGSITVTWNSVDKATNYRVYRRTGDKTSWDIVKSNTTALSWTDTNVLKGKAYTYSVCVIKSDGSEELSEFNSTGVTVVYYDPPTLTKAVNGKNGVDLTWTAVDYVGTYNVYRKTGNDVDWKLIGTKTGTTFTDTNVKSNAHYIYAVRSTVSGTVASAISNSRDTTYHAAPKMTSIKNGKNRITITWSQESGIDTYRVFRSTNGGKSWTKLKDVSATTYTDTATKTAGTKYTYAVECVKDGASVSAKNTAVSITYVAPVTNVKAKLSGTKAVITWTKTTAAKYYDVYRRKNLTSTWTKVGTVENNNTLTDAYVPADALYFYKVIAVTSDRSLSTDSAQAAAQ